MAKKSRNKKQKEAAFAPKRPEPIVRSEIRKSIWAIVLIGFSLILTLAVFKEAGPFGDFLYSSLAKVFGIGYFVLPVLFVGLSVRLIISGTANFGKAALIGAGLFLFSILGLIDLFFEGRAGFLGKACGYLENPLGKAGASIAFAVMFAVSVILIFNAPLETFLFGGRKKEERDSGTQPIIPAVSETQNALAESVPAEKQGKEEKIEIKEISSSARSNQRAIFKKSINSGNYVAPPLSLLRSSVEKPTSGDLRANSNIIKRTLESFGISVEMGEINIGPKFTRYTLKPAEGVKLSRITALGQDIALSLAAHPIRIEAPIPGKSLVGIEVPNKTAAIVRLGSLMSYPEFTEAGILSTALGRDVNGDPIFTNIEKMPHLLVAGATGSGKSIVVHSLLISLLYKNSPDTLRMILVDPKKVEMTLYKSLPHLLTPVITEPKKAISALRWAIKEMERRYEILMQAGCRDIQSYNKKFSGEGLSFILIVIDELADLMSTYGRDVEASIVRLAQMARAVGIHLIVSTQRPSVEVVTGLIKANITSRVALQLPSQVDSRTILDTAGAEKLLGGGDMLYVSSAFSKPHRIQGAFVSEEEIAAVTDFIRENNKDLSAGGSIALENGESSVGPDEYLSLDEIEEEDDLLEDAINVVKEAKKASASLLQRRLKVGYARAARLLDIMEAKGIIGPGDGAKPREVYIGGENNGQE